MPALPLQTHQPAPVGLTAQLYRLASNIESPLIVLAANRIECLAAEVCGLDYEMNRLHEQLELYEKKYQQLEDKLAVVAKENEALRDRAEWSESKLVFAYARKAYRRITKKKPARLLFPRTMFPKRTLRKINSLTLCN